ncbi:MAG: NAD/NADP octopine/nopaline dehydrogenase family protein [Acetobacteraceae bacterium]|nr:NAD/NADP octopine/nopaline dehydrogenase family protein [Acetobacteraceae bacterium]
MRLAILGDGAIARGSAALAVSRGHGVVQWSRGFKAGGQKTLHCEGALKGDFPVSLAAGPKQALDGADAAAIIVPANGHRFVMEAIAPHLAPGVPVLVIAAASLSPTVLTKLTGGRNPVAALGTTPVTGRTAGEGVRMTGIRPRVGVFGGPAMLALAEALWGEGHFDDAPDLIAAALSNINPIAHLAIALCNVTRIEHRESWPQYGNMTVAVCRLIEALDDERQALAHAYGTSIPTARQHFVRSNATTAHDLAGMTAEIQARGGGVNGPTDMDTRYILEDVPFGLVFYQWLARHKRVALPLTDASVALASALWGRDLAAMNDLIPLLDPPG